MKIGVISDSHGNLTAVRKALSDMGEVDLIIHCGDYAADVREIKNLVSIPVMAVRGNCDYFDEEYPNFIDTNFAGHHLLIQHGHRQNVKSTMNNLQIEAKAHDADLVFFGHTHQPVIFEEDGVTYINPGSVALPNYGQNPSYALLDLHDGQVDAEIKFLEKKKKEYPWL